MENRIKKRLTMGRVLITIGILLRIFQVVGSYLHLHAASGAILSVCMLCFFTGGLSVFAYEHRGCATLFAVLCALCSLLSTFMISVAGSGTFVKFISIALYFLTFATFGIMIYSMGQPLQKGMGVLIILLGAGLVLPIAGAAISEGLVFGLLCGIWIIMGISVFI